MIKKTFYILSVSLLCSTSLFTSCDIFDGDDEVAYMLPQTKTVQMTNEQKAMVSKSNDFSFNLFREIYASR